jgi:hypothetical protein
MRAMLEAGCSSHPRLTDPPIRIGWTGALLPPGRCLPCLHMQAHIVPRFHLGRFATPPGRNGFIYLIDKPSGQNARVPVKQACTAEDFYVIEDDAGNQDAVLEDMLQKIESYSARRIDRLVNNPGETPPDDERLTLALYLVLTNTRTPRMREQLRWTNNAATLAYFRSTLDAGPPWERMRAAVFPEMSDEEAEEFRRQLIDDIDSGKVLIEFPERHYIINSMSYITDQAYIAAEMSWTVMRAPAGSEYVIGDHAVSMYDPNISAWALSDDSRGNALASSPLAETILPLDRRVAVKLSFGEDEDWQDVEVSADDVDEVNLRTYSWAEREIYGPSQGLVVAVRERARANRPLMAQYRPHHGGLLVENDYPAVDGGHRRDLQILRPPS